MALIACGECGKQISDKAIACPGCGCRPKFNKPLGMAMGMLASLLIILAAFYFFHAGQPKVEPPSHLPTADP